MRAAAFGAFAPKSRAHSGCARTSSHPTLIKRLQNSNHIPPMKPLHFGREGPLVAGAKFQGIDGLVPLHSDYDSLTG